MVVDILAEPLYSIPEIAEAFKLTRSKVTELFQDEPGVLCIGNPETVRGRRKYRTFRIPQSVLNRVVARLTKRG